MIVNAKINLSSDITPEWILCILRRSRERPATNLNKGKSSMGIDSLKSYHKMDELGLGGLTITTCEYYEEII